jgi:MFS superfamily sulfate permease-like transporter
MATRYCGSGQEVLLFVLFFIIVIGCDFLFTNRWVSNAVALITSTLIALVSTMRKRRSAPSPIRKQHSRRSDQCL